MPSITMADIRKSYGAAKVVHGVDVTIEDGEFCVLVGPSGCGKSTLLRMIAGLEDISGGDLMIDDRRMNDIPAKRRDIAMVFQNYALYPQKTVAQNLAFPLTMRKMPKEQIAAKVTEAAAITGLSALLDRRPSQLSGGQRQRVAMGRAIVRDPSVFLFDEPLSNLDAALRVKMRAEIRALQQRLGTTTVYVTHDQVEAMTMADKIVVMRAGKVEQIGHPLELYDTPVNAFVAGFIGSPAINLLPVSGGDSAIRGPGDAALPVVPGIEVQPGQPLLYGIRPEHLRLDEGGVQAIVDVVEPGGSDTTVVSHLDDSEIIAVLPGRHRFKRGETIRLGFDPSVAHLFDASKETTPRLVPVRG